MEVRSLAYRTDLMIVGWGGRVEDRADCVVARTPASPRFYFGNFVLFPAPPHRDAIREWPAAFRAAFAEQPDVRHLCLAWDGIDDALGDVEPFLEAGYVLNRSVVLAAAPCDVRAPARHAAPLATIRPLVSDADWRAATALQIITSSERLGRACTVWQTHQMARHRDLVRANRGLWLGAFVGDELAADLGVFFDGDLGRFQAVETDPAYRRRGLCAALVEHAARSVIDLGVETLVMVADPEYHAARIYESVGFRPRGQQLAVYRHQLD